MSQYFQVLQNHTHLEDFFIFSDTICDLGGAKDLANYGEYSGAPSEQQTYEYAKTILSLMTAEIHPDGKILIVGGGIANFTNVAATFKVHFLKVTLVISYAIFSVLQNYSYKSVLSNKGIPCGAKNPCCFISREMKLNNAYFRELLEPCESTSRS